MCLRSASGRIMGVQHTSPLAGFRILHASGGRRGNGGCFCGGELCALGRVHDAQGSAESVSPSTPGHISPCCVRWQERRILELPDNNGLHALIRARAAARHEGRAGGLISASSALDVTNRLRQSRAAESGGFGVVKCSTACPRRDGLTGTSGR